MDVPAGGVGWALDIQWEFGVDLGYYVAFNRQPTESDYDFGNASNSTDIFFECSSACAAEFLLQARSTISPIIQSQACLLQSVEAFAAFAPVIIRTMTD